MSSSSQHIFLKKIHRGGLTMETCFTMEKLTENNMLARGLTHSLSKLNCL